MTQYCTNCTVYHEVIRSTALGSNDIHYLSCGHSVIVPHLTEPAPQALSVSSESSVQFNSNELESAKLNFDALDSSGHSAWDYQKDGVQFILDGDFNVILADQMRLGKTPQALLALRNRYTERKRVLISVKSANIVQWIREYKKWTDSLPLGIYPIMGSKAFIPPGFHTYIISHDLISKPGTCKNCKHQMHEAGECGKCNKNSTICLHPIQGEDSMLTKLLAMDFDLMIVDEFHNFKNTDSKRSIAFNAFLQTINTQQLTHSIEFHCMMCKTVWNEQVTIKVDGDSAEKSVTKTSHCPKCFAQQTQRSVNYIKSKRLCPCLTLSGTPLENLADEYYPALHTANPKLFPSRSDFRRNWLSDASGKWARLKSWKVQQFREATKPFILRREWDDVYSSRPKMTRSFTVIKLEDQPLKELYNRQLDKIELLASSGRKLNYFETIGELSILRQICGLAKTKWTADFLESALVDSSRKFAVGINHYGVRDQLKLYCSHLGVITLDGTDSPQQKDAVQRNFERDSNKVMVINMIAGGEGMDFSYVPEVIVLEREWRSTREKQFEARFYNPNSALMAQRGYENKLTNIEYVVCQGTIDEWFHDMLLDKEKIFEKTVGNNWDLETDGASFTQLVERTLSHRL